MSSNKNKLIEIKELQSFLRKSLKNSQLELVKYEASNMVPLGENYASITVKLDVTIRKTKDTSEEEQLHFFAKMVNYTQHDFVNWADVFRQEVFVYTVLLPTYVNLEQELGIKEVFNAYPKYIGHRYSLDDSENISNEDSMLVLENLKQRGFYMGDRRTGLDFEHAKLALKALAKFHALGIALKTKHPELDFVKMIISRSDFSNDYTSMDTGFDSILDVIRKTKSLNKHLSVIEPAFAEAKNGNLWFRAPTEPWATRIHGDFWMNNMMFRKNEDGHVEEIKLIDFQICLYNSPLKDLPCFIYSCQDVSAENDHMDDLIEVYYKAFLKSLKQLDCDIKPFHRESFDRELKKQAIIQFPLCALGFKFLVFEINEKTSASTIAHEIFTSQVNDDVVKHLELLIEYYEKKGWF